MSQRLIRQTQDMVLSLTSGESLRVSAISQRIGSLTALRFIAAMLLVAYHTQQTLSGPAATDGLAYDQGVSFFFVLSGFILALKYPAIEGYKETTRFFVARFARIWPAYLAVIALFFGLTNTWWVPHGGRIPWITVLHITMMQSWVPRSSCYFALNAPAWSVSTEFFFYLLFPVLIRKWKATWLYKLLLCAAITASIILTAQFFPVHHLESKPGLFNALIYVHPVSRLFEFTLGMAATLIRWPRFQTLDSFKCTIVESLLLLAVALNFCLVPRFIHENTASAAGYWLLHCSGALIFPFLIALFSIERGLFSKVFRHPTAVYLGEISYSMYLLHWPLLQMFRTQALTMNAFSFLLLFGAALLLSSTLLFYVVEKPLRRHIRNIFLG
ncbi:MAG TPA: acyltransferase [Oculatellaceae cyanobacterium]